MGIKVSSIEKMVLSTVIIFTMAASIAIWPEGINATIVSANLKIGQLAH